MAAALAASASSSSKQPEQPVGQAPPPQQMDVSRALGLWKSSFGAVKIEEDATKGAGAGFLHGVWVYQRAGQDVIGYFGGNLRGNVLNFSWKEPSTPAPLVGEGYLVFDPNGGRFSGKWWTANRDRTGEWNGWRLENGQPAAPPQNDPYGGQTYGYGYPPPPSSGPY